MKNTAFILMFCMFAGQFVFSQTTFRGELNLNQKDKKFSLISINDSLSVSIDKKDIDFNASNDFQLIKIKKKEYDLIVEADTIKLTESKSKIEYSNGLKFNISAKKAHQIVLADEKGEIVLDATYKLKGNTAYFEIKISDMEFKTELLAYSTKYLYELSFNEVNTVPYYFFMY